MTILVKGEFFDSADEYYKYMTEPVISLGDLLADFVRKPPEKPTVKEPYTIAGEEWMGGYTWEMMLEELAQTIADMESHETDRMYLQIGLDLEAEQITIDYIDGNEFDLVLTFNGRLSGAEAIQQFINLGAGYNAVDLVVDGERRIAQYKGKRIEIEVIDGLPY